MNCVADLLWRSFYLRRSSIGKLTSYVPTVSCPIFPSILIAKNLLTGSLKNRSIDNLETQKKLFQ
jgi:predicted AlkP superfamily phosphohydrolase/phosphomutase